MNLNRIFTLAILTLCTLGVYAQYFNAEDQYQQAMLNAKTAFEANQYSQAVMFYREAIKIKPDALLAKYKVEDIRTIYIKNELDSLKVINPPVEKVKKKKKKEIEAEKVILAQKAEIIATEKMNKEADLAKQELQQLTKYAEVLDITDTTLIIDEDNVQDTEPDRETSLHVINSKDVVSVDAKELKNANNLTVTTQEVPEIEIVDEPVDTIEIKPIPKPVEVPKTVVKTTKPIGKPVDIKNTDWIKVENGRLAKKYPNNKTVEDIEKPGKLITRVIMNIDSKVTVYLKVKHSWGATYYFVDEIGLELRSISQTYFNLMTDLSTYKNN